MLTLLASLALALSALLLIPIKLAVTADPHAAQRVRVELSWLFGLVQRPVGGERRRPPRPRRDTRSEGKPRFKLRQGLAFLRGFGGAARVQDLIRDVINSLQPRVERLTLTLGLDDPADTGQAWAVVGPASAWLSYRFAGAVMVVPSFVEPALALEGRAHFTVIPMRTLAVLFGYLVSASTLRGLYFAHRAGAP